MVDPPDLADLVPLAPSEVRDDGPVALEGVLVEGLELSHATSVRIAESELRHVVVRSAHAPGLAMTDVVLRDCALLNVDGREGSLRRVEIAGSSLVGLGLAGGSVRDLRVVDSSLTLASLAFTTLRNVTFERVDLVEASFLEAELDGVQFIDCKLAGADFRGARTGNCAIRGSSLDGVLGVAGLRGTSMPWSDVVASAAALAAAVGIVVEP